MPTRIEAASLLDAIVMEQEHRLRVTRRPKRPPAEPESSVRSQD